MFKFQQFTVHQDKCAMKVGTDGVLLGAWAKGGNHILDIGTGTGLIALMMAQRYSKAIISAVDIDEDACIQARENVDECSFKDRIHVFHSSLQDFSYQWLSERKPLFDSIVSNPPFFVNSLKNPDQKRTLARHADTLPFSDLFRSVSKLLTVDGVFSAIIPTEQIKDFMAEAYLNALYPIRIIHVKTTPSKQPKRCLLAFSPQPPHSIDEQTINLLTPTGERSDWYQEVTKDFYL